jgi:hypothetical protein
MTHANDAKSWRRIRIAGPLSLAAATATILLAGLAIAVLASAEVRVRDALRQERTLDAAVRESAACAGAVAGQAAAWKSYVLCELWNDTRGSNRAKSALATATSELNERLPGLTELAAKAQLPAEGALRATACATDLTGELVEAIADTRGAADTELNAVDREIQPRLDQARHDLSALSRDWNEIARARRLDATSDAAGVAGRMKAWIEILSVVAIGLVIAVGIAAVRKEALRDRG